MNRVAATAGVKVGEQAMQAKLRLGAPYCSTTPAYNKPRGVKQVTREHGPRLAVKARLSTLAGDALPAAKPPTNVAMRCARLFKVRPRLALNKTERVGCCLCSQPAPERYIARRNVALRPYFINFPEAASARRLPSS